MVQAYEARGCGCISHGEICMSRFVTLSDSARPAQLESQNAACIVS